MSRGPMLKLRDIILALSFLLPVLIAAKQFCTQDEDMKFVSNARRLHVSLPLIIPIPHLPFPCNA